MHENVRAIILLRPIYDEVSLSNPNIFSTTCESDLIHQEKLACFNHEMHQTLLAARVAVLSTSEDSTSPPSAGHIVSRSSWLDTSETCAMNTQDTNLQRYILSCSYNRSTSSPYSASRPFHKWPTQTIAGSSSFCPPQDAPPSSLGARSLKIYFAGSWSIHRRPSSELPILSRNKPVASTVRPFPVWAAIRIVSRGGKLIPLEGMSDCGAHP